MKKSHTHIHVHNKSHLFRQNTSECAQLKKLHKQEGINGLPTYLLQIKITTHYGVP